MTDNLEQDLNTKPVKKRTAATHSNTTNFNPAFNKLLITVCHY